jgi:hypothetical protein
MAKAASMAFGPGFGGDGGFWMIGADGKLHWVPPWDPEISRDLGVATSLAALSAQVKDTVARTQLIGLARDIAATHTKAIQDHTRSITH